MKKILSTPHSVASYVVIVLIIASFQTPRAFGALFEKIDRYTETALGEVETFAEKTPLKMLNDERNKWAEKYALRVKPYFKAQFDITDNVFKEPDPDKSDLLWTYTPGVTIDYQAEYGRIGVAYEAEFKYFTKFPKQNEQDQAFAAYADLYPTQQSYINVTENLAQEGATAGARFLEPINYLDNTVNITAGYKIERHTLEFSFQDFFRNYASEIHRRFDYDDDKFSGRLYWDITDKMKYYLSYSLGFIEYDEDPARSTTYHELLPVGLQGIMPGGAVVSANAGVNLRNVHSDHRNDFHYFVTSISLKKTFGEKTTAEIVLLRRPVEATFDNQTIFDEKLLYGGVSYVLAPKVRVRLGVSVANRDFEEPAVVGPLSVKRTDDSFGINLGFDYAAKKWLIWHFDYRYERRNSNISGFDYTENRLSIGTTLPL